MQRDAEGQLRHVGAREVERELEAVHLDPIRLLGPDPLRLGVVVVVGLWLGGEQGSKPMPRGASIHQTPTPFINQQPPNQPPN